MARRREGAAVLEGCHRAFLPFPHWCAPAACAQNIHAAADTAPLWGWSARRAALQGQAEHEPWQHQRLFKLHLAGDSAVKLPPLPPHRTAAQLVADFLRPLAQHALQKMCDKFKYLGSLTFRDVQWCLTVPAQWQQTQRVAMEAAAVTAGLVRAAEGPDNGGSPWPVSIVLEPEAASVFCFCLLRRNDVKAMEYMQAACRGLRCTDTPQGARQAVPGGRYWRRHDGPGGALAHRHGRGQRDHAQPRRPDWRCASHCAGWRWVTGAGSTVDAEFMTFVRANFSTFDSWLATRAKQQTEMMQSWEQGKRAFTGKEDEVLIELPNAVSKALFDGETDAGFPRRQVELFFDPAIDAVVKLVREQLAAAPAVASIFLVGGFSVSKYLRDRIVRELRPLPVYTLPLAAESVVIGAALLGRFPKTLESRCMKKSYGFVMGRPAIAGDPEGDVRVVNGKLTCTTCFDAFVTTGQPVPEDHAVEKRFAAALWTAQL